MAPPAETSPPPAHGDARKPADTGRQGDTTPPATPGSAQPALHPGGDGTDGRESARLPGLPRLFFADQPDQRQQPLADPTESEPPGTGHSPLPSLPAGPDQPNGLGGHGQPGQPGGAHRAWQRQPAPPRSSQRPPRTRPAKQPDSELRQRALAGLALAVLSLVASLLALGGNLHRFVDLLIFSAVIGVAAAVIGITAAVKARRTGTYRPRGAVGGIVLGAMAALPSILLLGVYLAFPRQVSNYVTCVHKAQSASSQLACTHKLERSIRLGSPAPGTGAAVRLGTPAGPAWSAASVRLVQGSADGPRGGLAGGAPNPSLAHLSR